MLRAIRERSAASADFASKRAIFRRAKYRETSAPTIKVTPPMSHRNAAVWVNRASTVNGSRSTEASQVPSLCAAWISR